MVQRASAPHVEASKSKGPHGQVGMDIGVCDGTE